MIIKIISQDGMNLFDFERTNIIATGNKILICDKVNAFESKTALLGIYQDEEQCKEVFNGICNLIRRIKEDEYSVKVIEMPSITELIEEGRIEDGGE